MSPGTDLARALDELAGRRPLLVGLDFDGVLAPIVERPDDATALPGTMDAVRGLAGVDGVTVALVSGRARDDLAARSGIDPDAAEGTAGGGADGAVVLVGSHGAELVMGSDPLSANGSAVAMDDAAYARLAKVQGRLEAIAAEHPGAHVELKPSAAVLHTRRLARGPAQVATAQALAVMAGLDDVHVTRGKEVVEVAVTPASKGTAICRLREHLDAAAVLYLGDDVTDETVFAVLGPGDVGVKVGDGDTAAAHRIAGPEDVRDLLRDLLGRLTS